MVRFVNDYSEGAHPRVLEALVKSNTEQNDGYGLDEHSRKASQYLKHWLNNENVDIHFIPGGTQTNLIVISSFLRPHEGVITADTGHINVHETGAIEATGHKVITVPAADGKLSCAGIRRVFELHESEHMVKPKMVYLSDTTELGTIYTKSELTQIHQLCKELGLLLFLDGARISSALACEENDLSLEDIAALVDVFYIGGTKNGALLGEALVIIREDLKQDFRYYIKQKGALLAKGFVMGVQFEALFEDGLYFELGRCANDKAKMIGETLKECGYQFYATPCSNQLFPIVTKKQLEKLSGNFLFLTDRILDNERYVVRFVTSWATPIESIEALCIEMKRLSV